MTITISHLPSTFYCLCFTDKMTLQRFQLQPIEADSVPLWKSQQMPGPSFCLFTSYLFPGVLHVAAKDFLDSKPGPCYLLLLLAPAVYSTKPTLFPSLLTHLLHPCFQACACPCISSSRGSQWFKGGVYSCKADIDAALYCRERLDPEGKRKTTAILFSRQSTVYICIPWEVSTGWLLNSAHWCSIISHALVLLMSLVSLQPEWQLSSCISFCLHI